MITRVAVLPYPPLLVPELTGRSAPETERVRDACLRAASSLTQSSSQWVAVGVDRHGPRRLEPGTAGTFADYGVDVPVSFGGGESAPDPRLPLPALVAGWLRERAGAAEVTMHLVAAESTPAACRRQGASLELAARDEPMAMLVLADGTNRRDGRSPFPPDDRAEDVDNAIRSALAGVEFSRLLALDPVLLARLGVEGRAALQVMAGAVEASGHSWRAELLYSGTPFGVTYHVAVWTAETA